MHLNAGEITERFVGLEIGGEHHESMAYDGFSEQAPSGEPSHVEDITRSFREASSALAPGHVVKDDDFHLYEATAAVEIMDPKMDTGLHFHTPGELEYDVMQSITSGQLIGLMDQLLGFEMGWHKGFALNQTLFSSYYIDRLLCPQPTTIDEARFYRESQKTPRGDELVHIVLRAYCVSLIKTCDHVRLRISAEKIYEEEDFSSNLYQRDLLSCISGDEAFAMLVEAVRYMEDDSLDIDKAHTEAIIVRLNLRRNLLEAICWDFKDSARISAWNSCKVNSASIKISHELAIDMPAAYSIKVQRMIATTTPPRPIVELLFEDAVETLVSLHDDGADAYKILKVDDHSNLLQFNSKRPLALPFVRCLLQSLIWHDQKVLGRINYQEFIIDDIDDSTVPLHVLIDVNKAEAPQTPEFHLGQMIEQFVRSACEPLLEVYSIFCMNRSRARRNLCHLIMEWEALEANATELDIEMAGHPNLIGNGSLGTRSSIHGPFHHWTHAIKLSLMERAIQLGFELDVYQNDEIAAMYRYLSLLMSEHLNAIKTQRSIILALLDNCEDLTSKALALQRTYNSQSHALMTLASENYLAEGLFQLYSTLSLADLLPPVYQKLPYGEPAKRYDLRMKPFKNVATPKCPTYDEMMVLVSQASTHMTDGIVHTDGFNKQSRYLLAMSAQNLASSKQIWAETTKWQPYQARSRESGEWWRTDMRKSIKACLAANATCALCTSEIVAEESCKLTSRLKITIPDSIDTHHPWWIVPKVERMKAG